MQQLVVVRAPDWLSVAGELRCFRRAGDGDWLACGQPLAVGLGRNGLAWDASQASAVDTPFRLKTEGDGCAPAGIFPIMALFGTVPDDSDLLQGAMPFIRTTSDLRAIDDPASTHYNRIVDATAIAHPDWSSSETMLRDDGRYALGAVVGYNTDPVRPGAGSCIFIHVREDERPTAGCTALSLPDMHWLAGWLDAAASPCLVQLPEMEYAQRCRSWDLPRSDT